MKLPERLTTPTRFSKTISILLFISLPIIGFFLGIRYQALIVLEEIQEIKDYAKEAAIKEIQREILNLSSGRLHNQCLKYDLSPKKDFLKSYTIKSGDTLLSISKNELNDISRVNDIIILNIDRYPSLSLENPFLEQGWILYLPPDYITGFKNDLFERSGEVTQVTSTGAIVVRSPRGSAGIYPDKKTLYLNGFDFKVGDCVTYVSEVRSNKVYIISKQTLNGSSEKCADSKQQCLGRPNGTQCTYGVWCNEEGEICGGQSCVDLGLGRCEEGDCELIK